MKICPQCSRQYQDIKLDYCLECNVALQWHGLQGQTHPYLDNQTYQNIQPLINHYTPNGGRFSSLFRRWQSEGRVKMLKVLNEEQLLVIEQGAILNEAIRNGQKSRIDFEMFIAQNHYNLLQIKANEHLLFEATKKGLTVLEDQTRKRVEHSNEIYKDRTTHDHKLTKDLEKLKQKYDKAVRKMANDHEAQMLYAQQQHEIRMLEKVAEMRIYEANSIGDAQLQRELDLWNEKFRLAIIGQDPMLSGMQKRKEIQRLIDKCYKEIQEIKENTKLLPDIQTRMIQDREEMIEFFKGEDKVKVLRW